MRSRRIRTIQDVNALPVTKIESVQTPRNGLRAFQLEEETRIAAEQAAHDAAENERLMAPVRAAEQELREAVKEASRRLTMFWSRPLSVISSFEVDFTPCDLIGDYIEGSSDSKADAAAYREFKTNLAATGCSLSADGANRLGGFLESLRYHRGVSLAVAANWHTALERLVSLGAFQPGEISGYQPQVTEPQPKPAVRQHNDAPMMKDLLSVDAGTQEGQRAACQIADALYELEMLPLFREWVDLIRTAFGHVVTRKDANRINAWFAQNNRSWLRHESYNEVRRWMVSQGHWPRTMLTQDELNVALVEGTDLNNYDAKRDLFRRIEN